MMTVTIDKSIKSRIYGHGRGWSFTPKDFLDLGSRESIDITLHRLQKEGTIRRVIRGVYDYPRLSKLTQKPVNPDIWSIAQTIARKNGWKILPSGETALNALGLSTQIPGTWLFYTDGLAKKYLIGQTEIQFIKKKPKDLHTENGLTVLVIQAIKALGKDQISYLTIKKLQEQLTEKQCAELLKKSKYGTDWVYSTIKKICKKENNESSSVDV